MTESTPDSPEPTPSPWIRPVILSVLLIPLLAGGVLLAIFFNMRTLEKRRAANAPKTPQEISLQAENTLLKKMLGEIEGRVAVLGPVEDGGNTRGKIVWDESLQQGFLFIAHLPEPLAPGKALFLWADTGDGKPLPCARLEPDPDGSVRRAFVAPQRILKVQKFILTSGDAQGLKNMREKILAEGALEIR